MATKPSKRKKKAPVRKPAKPVPKQPRSKALPGMEDEKCARLENLAHDYADVRDERMRLTTQEVELQGKLRDEMHRLEKTTYNRGPIKISIVAEKEKIKVRIKHDEPDDDDDAPQSSGGVSVETQAPGGATE